ncbi:post-transcriptional regulator [Bacillus aquiflavi]|uniref:Post-transcriptional regulator n=1 Tax=Bacillus aquiflavi TaxID=2672567 RepID=A0A6B3W0D4_9BACI|nr:post-transcriptional regulator [Bacillus aquiflavi]MBA4537165.1 post-transcriptional regulator [Bacillus aquiflavi]NEY81423.1 post-transcriptional regulator [Bacillus aquiflavi]UAC47388.1 post-transcriptional regulator [Bacillus aquiflavi]
MDSDHMYDRFRKQVQPAINSKIEEFALFGYETMTDEELWMFLQEKKWRKPKKDKRLYEIVQDIMSISVVEYMNYAMVEAYKDMDFILHNEKEREELLKD